MFGVADPWLKHLIKSKDQYVMANWIEEFYLQGHGDLVYGTAFALCREKDVDAFVMLDEYGLTLAILLGVAVQYNQVDRIRDVAVISPQRRADGSYDETSAISSAIFRAGVFKRIPELLLFREAGMEIPAEQAALLPPLIPPVAPTPTVTDEPASGAGSASASEPTHQATPGTATVALAAIKAQMAGDLSLELGY